MKLGALQVANLRTADYQSALRGLGGADEVGDGEVDVFDEFAGFDGDGWWGVGAFVIAGDSGVNIGAPESAGWAERSQIILAR